MKLTIEQKLLRHRIIMTNGCWISATNKTRYGKVWDGFKNISAHVAAASIWLKDYNPRLPTLHNCDNNRCFNPEHLFQGSLSTNMKDCVAKGRHRSGLKGRFKSRTHCIHGHEYTLENTYMYKGARLCKTCRNANSLISHAINR